MASGEDTRAHDIFRIYRTAFAEMGAGFHDLVIFGQHGGSSTSAALIPGLRLSDLQIPSLVLITGGALPVCHTTALPVGEAFEEEDAPWSSALDCIKKAINRDSPDQTDFPRYSPLWDGANYIHAFQGCQMRPGSLKFPAFIGQPPSCQA
ncbi:MAG: hypothetical protein O2913_01730, partial [Chloroflexi bacterium]|nr:hypothetical protein [Chloroflexota bacterium]